MQTDWIAYCHASDFERSGDNVTVHFDSGRAQRVEVIVEDDAYLLRSVVAKQAVVSEHPDAAPRTWLRNRQMNLVGFRIDERGRIVGEARAFKAGLTARRVSPRGARSCRGV